MKRGHPEEMEVMKAQQKAGQVLDERRSQQDVAADCPCGDAFRHKAEMGLPLGGSSSSTSP